MAGTGIYGVVSHRAAQRTYEIGVRLAIGARPLHIGGLICRQGLVLTSLGLALGLAGAVAASRLLEFVGVRDHDDRCTHLCRRHDPVGAGRPGGQPHTGHLRNESRPRRDNPRGVADFFFPG